jgi:hypothetical protein
MWPWEHLAFGYVLFSLGAHTAWQRPPRGTEAVALAVATQTPDLIDKPLAWGLELVPMGYALGHSVFFAVPVLTAVLVAADRRGRRGLGVAVAVGYLSHLLGDVLSPLLSRGDLAVDRLLWPFVTFPGYENDYGFVGRFTLYVGRYLHEATQPEHLPLLLAYLSVFGAVAALWLTDGAPGVRTLVSAFRPSTDG